MLKSLYLIYVVLMIIWGVCVFIVQRFTGKQVDIIWCSYVTIVNILFIATIIGIRYKKNLFNSDNPLVVWWYKRRVNKRIKKLNTGK